MQETTMSDELDDDEARALRAQRIIEAVAAIPRGRPARVTRAVRA
jgi:methylated-DNA-protein-cysteine methyltransferase-like protein